jgi:hypothetical protein
MIDCRPKAAHVTGEWVRQYIELAKAQQANQAVATLASAAMIADALYQVAHALVLLGNAGALTHAGSEMGAIEALSIQVREGLSELAGSNGDLQTLANAITEGFNVLSDGVEDISRKMDQ